MRVRIDHHTVYEYNHPVHLDSTILRLTPRPEPAQRCLKHTLHITPEPSGISTYRDECDNIAHTVWFLSETQKLVVDATMEVETLLENPFDYMVTDPVALLLPMHYEPETATILSASIRRTSDAGEAFDKLVAEVLESSKYNTLKFLSELCERIASEIGHEIRENGDPQTPLETFTRRSGACRDVAVVFIECCRAVGIAARFISGYKCGFDRPGEDAYMHAWAEVFLPGAGWRGYDPSIGLAVSDGHIVLASAPFFGAAAPIVGAFRASVNGIQSQMSARVYVTPLESL
jgi:transglutaminase-like putative cysteine protease